jgi:hypothetical protein
MGKVFEYVGAGCCYLQVASVSRGWKEVYGASQPTITDVQGMYRYMVGIDALPLLKWASDCGWSLRWLGHLLLFKYETNEWHGHMQVRGGSRSPTRQHLWPCHAAPPRGVLPPQIGTSNLSFIQWCRFP